MKTLAAEFARRPPPRRWPWIALIFALSLFAFYQGWCAWNQHVRLAALQMEKAELDSQLERAGKAYRDAVARSLIPPAYAADAALIQRLARFPLDRVLAAIESARVPGVKLAAIEISAADWTARAELEAVDQWALLAYLDELNTGEPTPRWVLLQAQTASGSMTKAITISSW